MKVLLSIKPEFVEEIMAGRKKYEYRKKIFKRNDISKIVIYASKPYGKVVGEFEIGKIIKEEPQKIWNETKQYSGISKKAFNEYFSGKETGFAIQIKSFNRYENPIVLEELSTSIKSAPQSFCYLDLD